MYDVRFIIFDHEEVEDFLKHLPKNIRNKTRDYLEKISGCVTDCQEFSNIPDELRMFRFNVKNLDFNDKVFVKYDSILVYPNGGRNIGLRVGFCEVTIPK